jgi:DNA-binding GntR family transcriptional regulator
MYRYRLEYIKDASKRQNLVVEHDHIIRAIREHRIDEARAAIRDHIDNQEITIAQNIKAQEQV